MVGIFSVACWLNVETVCYWHEMKFRENVATPTFGWVVSAEPIVLKPVPVVIPAPKQVDNQKHNSHCKMEKIGLDITKRYTIKDLIR